MPDASYIEVFADDKRRCLRVPLRMHTDRPRGFHDDERMIAYGYYETGDLMHIQDTERGKTLWPAKEPKERWVGRYDNLRVYFVQAETGQIKIGIAGKPEARLRDLQVGSPVKLTLLCDCSGGRPQEANYHRRFAAHHLHGEWFAPHQDILAEVATLKCR